MKYISGDQFSEGFAAVSFLDEVTKKISAGYIDKTGKEIIPFKYGITKSFSGGFAEVLSPYGF